MTNTDFLLTITADRRHQTLSAATLAAVRDVIGGAPAIALSPGEAAGFLLPAAPNMALVRAAIGIAAVDALLAPPGTRPCRLLIADMDSTIVTTETLDELAVFAGIGEQIAAITARTMNGELDFCEALRLRVSMLRGLPLAAIAQTLAATTLMGGARVLVQTMHSLGAQTALVSGGFTAFTGPIAALCGFDRHLSNRLIDDGKNLTGEVGAPILDKHAKLVALREIAAEIGITPAQALTVGDGANDLPMLQAAGLGIGFHAKPVVAAAIANTVQFGDLRVLLFAQGISAAQFIVD